MSTVKGAVPPATTSNASAVSRNADPNTSQQSAVTSTASAAPAAASQAGSAAAASSSTAASTSTTSSTTAAAENVPRSKYKTFILSNGVFEVEQRYEIREIIGQGAYGVVCSALDMKTNTLVAIKKIENVFDHRSLAKRTLRELKLCRYFQHENVSSVAHCTTRRALQTGGR